MQQARGSKGPRSELGAIMSMLTTGFVAAIIVGVLLIVGVALVVFGTLLAEAESSGPSLWVFRILVLGGVTAVSVAIAVRRTKAGSPLQWALLTSLPVLVLGAWGFGGLYNDFYWWELGVLAVILDVATVVGASYLAARPAQSHTSRSTPVT